jgi:hypothetical protein
MDCARSRSASCSARMAAWAWFRSGGVGVDIFFVLSGFLITTILRTERQRTGGISFRNFYARRFLRLAPALVLTCVRGGGGEAGVRRTLSGHGPRPGSELHGELGAGVLRLLHDLAEPLLVTGHRGAVLSASGRWSSSGWSGSSRTPTTKAGLLLAGAAGIAVYRAWHVGIWDGRAHQLRPRYAHGFADDGRGAVVCGAGGGGVERPRRGVARGCRENNLSRHGPSMARRSVGFSPRCRSRPSS